MNINFNKSIDKLFKWNYNKRVNRSTVIGGIVVASIEDVAKLAGVSKSLVSRYLNSNKGVGKEKRELIANAIETLGYRRNEIARSLVRQKTEAIGIVIDTLCYVQVFDLIKGLNCGAQETDYNILYCDCSAGENKAATKLKYIDFLSHNRVDGVILYGSFQSDNLVVAELAKSGFPFVLIENDVSGVRANKVLVDNRGGIREMVKHFYRDGCRDIRFMCWSMESYAGQERYAGYVEGLQECGMPVDTEHVYGMNEVLEEEECMERLVKTLVEQDDLPDAIVFGADIVAFTAIRMLDRHGNRRCKKIRLGGFDNDVYLGRDYAMPRLTTIDQPLFEMGRTAVHILVDSIKTPDMPVKVVDFPVKLVQGDT